MSPTIPTTRRIQPTVTRLIPETEAVTAQIKMAPAAMSKRLAVIPILPPFILAPLLGVEPRTFRLTAGRIYQLSYAGLEAPWNVR